MIERRVPLALIVTVCLQMAGTLIWAGAAAQRISALEVQSARTVSVAERLARLEAELEAVRAQLDRIEAKMDGP